MVFSSPRGHGLKPALQSPAHPALIRLLVVAMMAITTAGTPAWSNGAAQDGEAFSVPLRCQVDGGAWRACLMVVQQVGSQWHLVLGSERFGFQHDGRGLVQMQRGAGAWTPVQARWSADASLCWDGLCAQGAIPLD
jgi:hypothetical protein